jgi:hypothetical protein
MDPKQTLAQLRSLGDGKGVARNRRNGAGGNPFGVPLGELRKVAPKISTDASRQ